MASLADRNYPCPKLLLGPTPLARGLATVEELWDRGHRGNGFEPECRKTIAAGTLPNTRGNLAGWIADPQNIKPGTHMATVPVEPAEMQPLIDYLESLK